MKIILLPFSRVQEEVDLFMISSFGVGKNARNQGSYNYSHSLHKEYPTGLFPTAFFLWQSYLVLMPDTRHSGESQALRSVIRVHDLSNKRMQLVGSYDFPEDSPMRRHIQGIQGMLYTQYDAHGC